jgi:NAD(P)H-hydrate repair Nnr-like enzyme with NAD(P)H-hydrate dehydratase domain
MPLSGPERILLIRYGQSAGTIGQVVITLHAGEMASLTAAAGDRLAKKLGPVRYLARELLDEIPQLMWKYSH